jgi:hypothetical protein
MKIVFAVELVNTDGNEIAPGSDVIGEDIQDVLCHGTKKWEACGEHASLEQRKELRVRLNRLPTNTLDS